MEMKIDAWTAFRIWWKGVVVPRHMTYRELAIITELMMKDEIRWN